MKLKQLQGGVSDSATNKGKDTPGDDVDGMDIT